MAIRDSRESYNEYMRKYHLKRYYRIKNEILESLGGKCFTCGALENLEIDHIDKKSKTSNITTLITLSLEKLKKELPFCQLLCKSCHSKKTIRDSGKKQARGLHGTLSTYRYCKCDLCRKAKSNYYYSYKLRKL